MSYASTIRDLRAKITKLEKQKREVDITYEALHVVIRSFDNMTDKEREEFDTMQEDEENNRG